MFAPLSQSVLRSTLARLLRGFFIFILIVSNLLLPPAVVAQAAAADAPRGQAPAESPSAEPLPVPLYSPSFAPLGEPAAVGLTDDEPDVTSYESPVSADAALVTRDDAAPASQSPAIVTLSLLGAAGAAEQPAGAAVELLPAEQASALSPVGVAFRLPPSEPQASASGTLQVHIDYAQLAQAYGGSFAERLTLYRLTPCAEESEDPCQNWQVLAGVNDLAAQRLSVDLSASVESAAWSPQPVAPQEGAAPPPADDPTLTQRSYLPLIAAGNGAAPPVEEEIYVLAAAASSQQGSYKATPLTNVSDYQVSLATGAFQTGYPIALPQAAGGLAGWRRVWR